MSVSLESATRLNALKSKIDTAVGSTSSTLSEAVDNAIERGNIETEAQTVTPTAAGFDVTPSSGKYLSKVTVNPVPTETKSVTPTASAQTVTPSSGKFLSSVSVSAVPTQTKEVTPTDTDQTVYPDAGKFLSSVLVKAAQGGIEGVYTGKVTVATGELYLDIDTGVTIGNWAVFVMVGDEPPSFFGYVDRVVLLKEIVDGTIKWLENRSYVTASVLDSGAYAYTDTFETTYVSTSDSRVIIEAHSFNGSLSGTYTWYLIQ